MRYPILSGKVIKHISRSHTIHESVEDGVYGLWSRFFHDTSLSIWIHKPTTGVRFDQRWGFPLWYASEGSLQKCLLN